MKGVGKLIMLLMLLGAFLPATAFLHSLNLILCVCSSNGTFIGARQSRYAHSTDKQQAASRSAPAIMLARDKRISAKINVQRFWFHQFHPTKRNDLFWFEAPSSFRVTSAPRALWICKLTVNLTSASTPPPSYAQEELEDVNSSGWGSSKKSKSA